MAMKEMFKTSEKLELKEAITIDELFTLLSEKWDAAENGPLKLKKGLFGKSVQGGRKFAIVPKFTVKGNIVTVKRISSQSSVKVGGIGGDLKLMGDIAKGGLKSAVTGAPAYFNYACETAKEALQNHLK